MTISDIIQLVSVVTAIVIGLVSIMISVKTLKQSSKMMEESTRPVISIYTQTINTGTPVLFLIVKNFGNSSAVITKLKCNINFLHSGYYLKKEADSLTNMLHSVFAPGQSRYFCLDYHSIKESEVTFEIEYKSGLNIYSETMTFDLKSGSLSNGSKTFNEENELKTISYTLQEMLQNNL